VTVQLVVIPFCACSAGGSMVEHVIGPKLFTSTFAPIFLNSSMPAFSLLPDQSLPGSSPVTSRSFTEAVGACPVQISVLPSGIGAPPFMVTLTPRTPSSSEAVTSPQALLASAASTLDFQARASHPISPQPARQIELV
jgi:hypothetical protein